MTFFFICGTLFISRSLRQVEDDFEGVVNLG
jgi:hypothetical protein